MPTMPDDTARHPAALLESARRTATLLERENHALTVLCDTAARALGTVCDEADDCTVCRVRAILDTTWTRPHEMDSLYERVMGRAPLTVVGDPA